MCGDFVSPVRGERDDLPGVDGVGGRHQSACLRRNIRRETLCDAGQEWRIPARRGVIYSDDGSVSGALHRGAFGHNDDSSLFGTGIGCEDAVGRYRRKEHSVGGKRCEHRDVEALAFSIEVMNFRSAGSAGSSESGSQFPDIWPSKATESDTVRSISVTRR